MKYCKDCKHFNVGNKCHYFVNNPPTDKITGELQQGVIFSCQGMRYWESNLHGDALCGKEAKLWEEK